MSRQPNHNATSQSPHTPREGSFDRTPGGEIPSHASRNNVSESPILPVVEHRSLTVDPRILSNTAPSISQIVNLPDISSSSEKFSSSDTVGATDRTEITVSSSAQTPKKEDGNREEGNNAFAASDPADRLSPNFFDTDDTAQSFITVPVASASTDILLNSQLRLSLSQILKNVPFIVWAMCVAAIFTGLSAALSDEIDWKVLLGSTSAIANVFLAILIGQRVASTAEDTLLHLRDPAYLILLTGALVFAVSATVPSLPLADDSSKALFPHAHPGVTYSVDSVNLLNTLLTRFLGAVVLFFLSYNKTGVHYLQPDRAFMLKMAEDLSRFKSFHPENFDEINIKFARNLYQEKNDFSLVQNAAAARIEKITDGVGYVMAIGAATGTGPVWFNLTNRGVRRVIGEASVAGSVILSLPSDVFYGRFHFGFPAAAVKLFQTLQKINLAVAVISMFVISGIALGSGAGLDNEGKKYLGLYYGLFCGWAAAVVNQSGMMNLISETFGLKDRYKDFGLNLPQAFLQKLFKCYEVVLEQGKPTEHRMKLEDAYRMVNPTVWLKEKNKHRLQHGVCAMSPDELKAAKSLRDNVMKNADDKIKRQNRSIFRSVSSGISGNEKSLLQNVSPYGSINQS